MTETIVSAKTVEAAVALGAEQLGASVEEVKYEVIEEGKKGILGFGATDARVRVYLEGAVSEDEPEEAVGEIEEAKAEEKAEASEKAEEEEPEYEISLEGLTPEKAALKLLNTIIKDMGIRARAKIKGWEIEIPDGKSIPEKTYLIEIEGDGLGALIGRHGDVLDSLQYLANIAAGRRVKTGEEKKEYIKISLDIEGYRAKREATLKALARRMADKALKYHRNVTLEPMLAYERKIIHAELQRYDGVYTYSVGSDSDRKVVIALGSPESPERSSGTKRSGNAFKDIRANAQLEANEEDRESTEE